MIHESCRMSSPIPDDFLRRQNRKAVHPLLRVGLRGREAGAAPPLRTRSLPSEAGTLPSRIFRCGAMPASRQNATSGWHPRSPGTALLAAGH